MLDQIIKQPYYRQKHLDAPFLEERLKYIQYCANRGLSRSTLQDIARCLLKAVKFLPLKTRKIITLDEVESAANDLALYQYKHSKKGIVFSELSKKCFIRYTLDWLKNMNWLECLPEEKISLFNKIYKKSHTLRRYITAPLLEERLKYLQYLSDSGAKENTLQVVSYFLLEIMNYLNFLKLRIVSLHEIENAADFWINSKEIHKRKNDCLKAARSRFIYNASHWIGSLDCLEKPVKKTIPFEEYLNKYIKYMCEEQGLSEQTIIYRFFQLQHFLIHIYEKHKTFMEMTPSFLDDLITQEYHINKYSRITIRSYISNIRSFLRYGQNQKWCQKNLADSIKLPRIYQYETLPLSPNWEDIKKLLANTKTDHPTDIRDYAILMLISTYGMRSSEIKYLCLEDIDWKNEIIYVKRAKQSKSQAFPLSKSIGEAIINYLKKVRQNNCSLREIFLCMKAPYRALSRRSISTIVSRRLLPLDLKIKHHGSHSLRYACATHLINEGISLKEISDYLGHQALDNTRIYAKVDLTNLRKVSSDFKLGDLL